MRLGSQPWRGLNPTLLPTIVRLARREGKRVMAHVESAADFRVAVNASVDTQNRQLIDTSKPAIN
jgi:hypothetical protein